MSSPYVGECRLVGFTFAPAGWATCQGQTIAISANDTLFNLIGTTYGGDGQETFQLPNLQGRVPIHMGTFAGVSFVIGESGGVEQVTLNTQQIPRHNHSVIASSANGASNFVQNNILAANPTKVYYAPPAPATPMNAQMLQPAGGNQPHENLQPFLVMNWVISLYGIYPTQS